MGEKTSTTEINDLAKLVKAGHRGAVLAEFRERAQAVGVEGRAGGWIYLAGATKPIAQGWQGFADFLLDGLTMTARELRARMTATPAPEADLVEVLRDRRTAQVDRETAYLDRAEFAGSHAFRPGKADPRRCDFGDCGARAECPNHNGWTPRRIEFPTTTGQRKIAALAGDAPVTDPATDDNVPELAERIVRRAQYVALHAVLDAITDSVEIARDNCLSMGHGSAAYHDDNLLCGKRFDVEEIRLMVNAAAHELRVPKPYRAEQ